MPNPDSIESKYAYDPLTDRYIYTESVGSFNINYPIILTPEEYQDLIIQESLRDYYKEKVDAFDGKKEGSEDARKNLLPEFYVNSGFFETIFGGNTIEVIPQGSVEVDLGVLFSKQDNPIFSPRNRTNFTFDFDQRISLSLLGKVGTKLQVSANYDTQSTFDFQNLLKLEYDPTFGGGEDSIIQKLEVGNVSMPINSSLITGAQTLFGVKTELQFGKTRVTTVFSEQQSQTRSVTAQGGGTLKEFELFIQDYDDNRHYFLSQYFRDNYDTALLTYPYLNTDVQITRIEVWVTNRSNLTQNVRNIVALQDLGESNPNSIYLNPQPPGFINNPNGLPDNSNNDYNPNTIGTTGILTEEIRDIATAQQGFGTLSNQVNEGSDYGKIEAARKLIEGQEYILNTQLGYISLNQRLYNDEVLAVAFQYTRGGEVFQVGEFANDGIDFTATGNETVIPEGTSQSLVLKMLKSAVTNVEQPIWDLMMKNIYDIGAYQLSPEDFRLNIFYNETSQLNFITPVEGTAFPPFQPVSPVGSPSEPLQEVTLLRVFNLDRLTPNNDPQAGGDGFFDFASGITVIPENGKIVFTNAEPFGEYLFNTLALGGEDYEDDTSYNENQNKYVYDILYKSTKTQALDESEKNKFLLKGRYTSSGGDGIPIGGFNIPRGSVRVTAGGRVLVEGIDYTVNYQLGRVQILDEALKASNIPIEVSTENNSLFGQQRRRFAGFNIEHQFNNNFLLGATFLNLNERPLTQKANYATEPINNTILGLNGNYSTEVPFLTRLVNKLPNIDTDVPSNLSVRGEFAYLLPGSAKGTNFNGEATAYIDDFEGSVNSIDLRLPQSWFLSSRPIELVGIDGNDNLGLENGYGRANLNWYFIDPIFYSNQRPSGVTDKDLSSLYTSRVFIQELFPQQDLAQGQNTVQNTLDLVYYPSERGPYNFSPDAADGMIDPNQSWAGITRQLTSTDFEQQNVEYIEFWLQDPFQENPSNTGGKLVINLGNVSEDVLADGRKQYENGLPDSSNEGLITDTEWGRVPTNQSLIYSFDSTGEDRTLQDVGYDGLNDTEEALFANYSTAFSGLEDPSNDNYTYFLNTEGDIFERYKKYNGVDGNSPDTFSDTNRGNTTQPDAEDINRDNTMNTINSYFEYEINITPAGLNIDTNPYIVDFKNTTPRTFVDGTQTSGDSNPKWYQFRIPVADFTNAKGGASDFRSIRFMRMYVRDFTENTILRFGTLDLVRGDWRRYNLALNKNGIPPENQNTLFNTGVVSTQDNEGSYLPPPGIVREELNNNNTIVRQNEQSLVLNVCDLEPEDSRAVYKNINIDMRQYKKIRMFIHAEDGEKGELADDEMVGFIRLGNDFTQNYYQIEVPLITSQQVNGTIPDTEANRRLIWPLENEINLELDVLAQIKALSISSGSLDETKFYDVTPEGLVEVLEFDGPRDPGIHRVSITGNPSFGNVRSLMVGAKNITTGKFLTCAEVWFNELRLADMDNEGGWAAVLGADVNFADFATVSATGSKSTTGFGSLDQGPLERSLEDIEQYGVVTNLNLGQLLPKKWGLQIPFNYGVSEELITPEYDQQYKDIKLEDRINQAQTSEDAENIKTQSETYTKRKSINFIGVRKNKTSEKPARFYDVENLTFNYSYNKVEYRDFEIENSLDQVIRTGVNYTHSFQPKIVEPFKKNDSLFTGKYWKILKDFNLNLLPSNISINTDFNRQFNKQKFRDADLTAGNIGIEELFRRNYTFDFQYGINYQLTNSLSLNFTAANNNIVRNYFKDNIINGEQDPTKDVWDGFFDFGDPNRQFQQLGLNYEIPLNKIPTFSFVRATYSYTSDFQWQKGIYEDFIDPETSQTANLGNSIQNSNTHALNSTLDMRKFYSYLGIKKKRIRNATNNKDNNTNNQTRKKDKNTGTKILNTGIDILTSIKRIQFNYSENNGTFLPGYIPTPGFIGTLKPTVGYTFGSQSDIRDLAARNGWLTAYNNFNQQYSTIENKQIDYSANVEPLRDLKIDLVGNRVYSENFTENYNASRDLDGDGLVDYQSLTPNSFGNFNISTILIGTSFGKSDENSSNAFEDFNSGRLDIARRLALENGADINDVDDEGFPKGYGKTNQAVLLPAFLAAYTAKNTSKVKLSAFRDFPMPNWDVRYTGLMKFKWFKKRFRRFSLSHGYRANYTINQFRANLDYSPFVPGLAYDDQNLEVIDQGGNYKNETLYSNINLSEQFSPLLRIDMEMKNSVRILAEIKKDRLLSLSFDNNLLTEIQGQEYILGLGYRIKNVSLGKIAGSKKNVVSDINLKADVSFRDNKTIIRYLDLDNNQITAGQSILGIKFNADYAFSKNFTSIFYFDYTFSDYAISTAFPQTTIRSGITLRYNFGN